MKVRSLNCGGTLVAKCIWTTGVDLNPATGRRDVGGTLDIEGAGIGWVKNIYTSRAGVVPAIALAATEIEFLLNTPMKKVGFGCDTIACT